MGGLAHFLEEEGIQTTSISLIREHSEIIKPPRALWVPFELGRPLGSPGDTAFQIKVLKRALALLEAPAGPVLEDFDEEAPEDIAAQSGTEVWVCPINLPQPPAAADPSGYRTALIQEVAELTPWYEVAKDEHGGRTTLGLIDLDIEAIIEFLCAFLAGTASESPVEPLSLGEAFKAATEDLKAFYLEAAGARPGARLATGAEINAWFWEATTAGRFYIALAKAYRNHDDPQIQFIAERTLLPMPIREKAFE